MFHEDSPHSSGIEAGAIELQELVVAHVVAHPVHGGRTSAILDRCGDGRRSSAAGHGQGWLEGWNPSRLAGGGHYVPGIAPHLQGFANRRTGCSLKGQLAVLTTHHKDPIGPLHLSPGESALSMCLRI